MFGDGSMPVVCDKCGLPKELCVCKEIAAEKDGKPIINDTKFKKGDLAVVVKGENKGLYLMIHGYRQHEWVEYSYINYDGARCFVGHESNFEKVDSIPISRTGRVGVGIGAVEVSLLHEEWSDALDDLAKIDLTPTNQSSNTTKEEKIHILDELASKGIDGMDKEVILKETIEIKFKSNKIGTPNKWIPEEERTDILTLQISLQRWSNIKYIVVVEPHTPGMNIDIGMDLNSFHRSFKSISEATKEYYSVKKGLLDGDFTCVKMDYKIYFDWPSDNVNGKSSLNGYEEAFKIEADVIQPLLDKYPPEEYPREWMKLARTVGSGLNLVEQLCQRKILWDAKKPKSIDLFMDADPFREVYCPKCGEDIKKWEYHVCKKKGD